MSPMVTLGPQPMETGLGQLRGCFVKIKTAAPLPGIQRRVSPDQLDPLAQQGLRERLALLVPPGPLNQLVLLALLLRLAVGQLYLSMRG